MTKYFFNQMENRKKIWRHIGLPSVLLSEKKMDKILDGPFLMKNVLTY